MFQPNQTPSIVSSNSETASLSQTTSAAGKAKWTSHEDEILQSFVAQYNEKNWSEIATHLPGKTVLQCMHRWTKIIKPSIVKGAWTPEEDEKLVQWVETYGPNNWAQASKVIQGRSGKQCRERWNNSLKPDVKKGEWTRDEDEIIYDCYLKFGTCWSKMAKGLHGRSENSIKNRFYSTIRKINLDKKKAENNLKQRNTKKPNSYLYEMLLHSKIANEGSPETTAHESYTSGQFPTATQTSNVQDANTFTLDEYFSDEVYNTSSNPATTHQEEDQQVSFATMWQVPNSKPEMFNNNNNGFDGNFMNSSLPNYHQASSEFSSYPNMMMAAPQQQDFQLQSQQENAKLFDDMSEAVKNAEKSQEENVNSLFEVLGDLSHQPENAGHSQKLTEIYTKMDSLENLLKGILSEFKTTEVNTNEYAFIKQNEHYAEGFAPMNQQQQYPSDSFYQYQNCQKKNKVHLSFAKEEEMRALHLPCSRRNLQVFASP
mmetsp:Transcript_18210/g.15871  ORF Transcript_18210/g.15871 Transcript_18210/m.15871 type:complete len:485 (-) Transcript_18210:963-2417(-)